MSKHNRNNNRLGNVTPLTVAVARTFNSQTPVSETVSVPPASLYEAHPKPHEGSPYMNVNENSTAAAASDLDRRTAEAIEKAVEKAEAGKNLSWFDDGVLGSSVSYRDATVILGVSLVAGVATYGVLRGIQYYLDNRADGAGFANSLVGEVSLS